MSFEDLATKDDLTPLCAQIKHLTELVNKLLVLLPEEDKYYDKDTTKALLMVKSDKTLWQYRNEGILAWEKRGGKIVYTKESVHAEMNKQHIKVA